MRYAWLVLCLGGCQCLVPVNEFPEVDAGVDGGHIEPAPACNKPNDCTGDFKTTDWCWSDGGAEWSCVDHFCVPQCQGQGNQTCQSDSAAGCINCPSTETCQPDDCISSTNIRWRLEQLSCIGDAPLQVGDILHEMPNGGCASTVVLERDAGSTVLGTLYFQHGPRSYGDLELLGGTCLITGLPTGVERMQYDCPRCQLVIANW